MATTKLTDEDDDEKLGLGIALGFSFGLGFFILTRSQTLTLALKPISTFVKLSYVAIRAGHSLQSPSPKTLIFASKTLIKGLKCIKSGPSSPNPTITKLKSYVGVANLVRLARDETLELGVLRGGYKVSKNVVRVLEGMVGLQLHSAVRGGIDAIGLVEKLAVVVTEICRSKKRGFLWFGGRRRGGIRLKCERLDLCVSLGGFSRRSSDYGEELVINSSSDELLCLAIPICGDTKRCVRFKSRY